MRVILRLSHLPGCHTGIATLPDTLPHYLSVSSLLPPHLPVTLSLSLSLSFSLSPSLLLSKSPYQILEVTFSPVNLNHAYQFSTGLFILPINLFRQLTCEGLHESK